MPAAGRILPLLWVILLLAGCGTWDSAADGALRDGDESLGRRKLREALGHFRQAVAQAPASAAAHARRGAVAEVLGELDEAMDAYYEAARREPSALAYYRVGALAARMGATDGGVQWLGASAGMERGWRERLAEPGARWARSRSAARPSRASPRRVHDDPVSSRQSARAGSRSIARSAAVAGPRGWPGRQ